jgi:hypothetical protein
MNSGLRRFLAASIGLGLGLAAAAGARAGIIETSVFSEQGVKVDDTAATSADAKNVALMDVQVKAFHELVQRLGSDKMTADIAKWKPADIAPYLKSLSIEEESTAPGRYIGTFTVRFLPEKMNKLFEAYGIHVPTTQAPPIIVIPVYKSPAGVQLWEDNLWRKAWLDLHAEQSLVPILVPLGDLEDTGTLTADDAINADPVKIEAIRRRYAAPSILVAIAEPSQDNGLHVRISGETALGKVLFDKIYTSDDHTLGGAAAAAVERIDTILVNKYRDDAARAMSSGAGAQSVDVAVPFGSPTEWNAIRARILATPGVKNVDVSSLSVDGAVIKLTVTAAVSDVQQNMLRTGLNMAQIGPNWVIQPSR